MCLHCASAKLYYAVCVVFDLSTVAGNKCHPPLPDEVFAILLFSSSSSSSRTLLLSLIVAAMMIGCCYIICN